MNVSALAEALAHSRQPDGAVSSHDLAERLSCSGFDELARAVSSLSHRENAVSPGLGDPPQRPWV